jgi:hypothetical protein
MPANVPGDSFPEYLKCDLPFGYAASAPLMLPFAAPLKESQRKDVIDLQTRFLDLAERLADSHPWIAYLAALKHDVVLILLSKQPLQFCAIADQKTYNDAQQKWRALRKKSRSAIDDATALNCERLVLLQRESATIEDAEEKLRATLAAGYTALEPLPPEPPPPDRGWAALLPGGKEKAEAAQAKLKAWLLQDSYLRLCQKPVYSASSLPLPVRKHGLLDLPSCLAELGALRVERAALEAHYLTPYLST